MNVREGKYVGPLVVDGSLDLYWYTSLKELPEGLSVSGGLDLRGCTSLKELPEDLYVGGWLFLAVPKPNPRSGVQVREWTSIELPFINIEMYNNPAKRFIVDRSWFV